MNGNLKPLMIAVWQLPALAEFIDTYVAHGIPPHEAQIAYDHCKSLEVVKNDEYQVAIDRSPPHGFGEGVLIWHLSIKRLDRKPLHDWRDLQRIKEMICGEQFEALELYPSKERVVDTSNQYHLFVFMHDGTKAAPTIPVGWTTGLILEPGGPGSGAFDKAKQRPFTKPGEMP